MKTFNIMLWCKLLPVILICGNGTIRVNILSHPLEEKKQQNAFFVKGRSSHIGERFTLKNSD